MKKQTVSIEIESINDEGKGIGSFSDPQGAIKLAEVPFCIPGDLVEASVHRKKRGVFPGRLEQIVRAAPNRIAPKCIHFATCGGCSFQELPYDEQLAHKQNQVNKKFYGLLESKPIIGCETPYGYRNKMEFTFSQTKDGTRFLGLFMQGARGKVFNVKDCKLVSPWFNETLEAVMLWWEKNDLQAFYPPRDSGTLRTLTVRESATSGKRLVMLTVSGNPEYALHKPELQAFMNLFNDEYSVYLRIHQAIKGQPTEFFEMHLKGPECIPETLSISLSPEKEPSVIEFHISPTSFFQPNTKQALKLYNEALRLAELSSEDIVYDLYCGTGTLGLLSARFVKSVIGIEISSESSLDARENAKRNGIKNIEIFTGSVGDVLKKKGDYPVPTVVLLDPPRSGLDPSSLEEVLALKSPKIIYISCNPETQARDVLALIENGYSLNALQPVDQFPQTPHIENIAVLTKLP